MHYLILIGCILTALGCSRLNKDNEPKSPPETREEVQTQVAVYRPLLLSGLDQYGLVRMGGSLGDSALFSCLARVGGATDFDPMVLFLNGHPVRHPEIAPGISATPWSKDMTNGLLWCAYDVGRKGDKEKALEVTQALIDFGKAHADKTAGWYFCDDADRLNYAISDENWLGRCFQAPAVVKDIYRVHKWAGGACDNTCRYYSDVGVNIPGDTTGFARHLGVLTTVRNGLVDGALNDNSLSSLKKAAEAQPKNGLYLAAYHLFGDGDQALAFTALTNEALFPPAALPTAANYKTDYLFQRDDDSAKGPGADWLPDPTGGALSEGRGVDFVFAASLALGEIF